MSQLLDFYRGDGTDSEGRRFDAILAWCDDDLEQVHDYIQWLFPLPTPSNFNPDAPLLTDADVAAFQAEPALRDRLRWAFRRFLTFLGLHLADDGTVIDGPNFAARAPDVWAYFNHNWLRVTRVLTSLHLLGLVAESRAFFDWLTDAHDRDRFPFPENTFRHWTNAARN
jgi:hypothetical protein